MTKLNKYFREYIAENGLERFTIRAKNYEKAKQLLNKITKVNITSPNDFLSYYEDIAKSFYSSGLLRGKKTLAKKYKIIISIIKTVQQNKSSEPGYVFKKTIEIVRTVKGFGVNALTEIMNTYNPNKFAVANERTLKSLTDLGFAKYL